MNTIGGRESSKHPGHTRRTIYETTLLRKCVLDAANKRSSNRSWRHFFVQLVGSELYFYKPLVSDQVRPLKEVESVIIRHGIADYVQGYKNRPHVFSLHTIHGAMYLFEAQDELLLATWVGCINYMAALHSAPPLPTAVGGGMSSSHASQKHGKQRAVEEFRPPIFPIGISPHKKVKRFLLFTPPHDTHRSLRNGK